MTSGSVFVFNPLFGPTADAVHASTLPLCASMYPSGGELSQHEVLFYMVCPTFSSHSLRFWYCIEKAIFSKLSFCRCISSRQQRQPPSYRPCLRGMISTLPGQLPSRGRRLLRNFRFDVSVIAVVNKTICGVFYRSLFSLPTRPYCFHFFSSTFNVA